MWEGSILQYLWIVWLLSSLSLVRVYIFFIAYRSRMVAKPPRERFQTPRIFFQITTKGSISVVQESVNRVNAVCKEIEYKKYEVWVVSDVQEEFQNCRTIVVPKQFSCNAIFKGRALQYAVEIRKTEKSNTEDVYVFHLDDESLITKQTLCSVLSFLEDSPTPISEGLIIYPVHDEERIKITHLLDTLRPFCCFECLDFMHRGHPAYMHGSNLLVRSDMEEKVGWDNGKTIAEDSLFAINAGTTYDKGIFGWHGGVVEEKSPLGLRDFAKQRQRWFWGLVQNLRFLSFKDRVSQSVRAIVWSMGFFSGLVSITVIALDALYGVYQLIPIYLRIAFFVTTFLWLASYQIGAFLNGRYLSRGRRVRFHLLVLLSSFVLGMVESATPLLALINRPKTFEVVKK